MQSNPPKIKGVFVLAKNGSKLINISQEVNPFIIAENFVRYKQAEGVSNYTQSSFRSACRQFLTDYKGTLRESVKLNRAIAMFLADKKASYHNKLLQALRQFFDYCIVEGVSKQNPTDGIKFKRENSRIVNHSERAIKTLLSLPDQSTFAGLRDYCIMLVMLDCGIRPSELLQLKITDINLQDCMITVREEYSKTRQVRVLPFSPMTAQIIRKVIQARHEDWGNDIPILCSFSGNPLTTHNFQERFKQYAEQLGEPITPYHLRHMFALLFIRNGGSPFALQRIMGHTKMQTTLNYVNLAEMDIKENHCRATPLNSLFDRQHRKRNINSKKH